MADDLKFNTRKQKSFDYTSEAAKQLITIATAITVFTVTFNKDVAGGQPGNMVETNKWLLITAWIYFFISILGGLLTIYLLVGQLDSGEDDTMVSSNPSIWNKPVNFAMIFQQASFVSGLFFTATFGITVLYRPLVPWATIVFIAIPTILFILILRYIVQKPEETQETIFAHVEGNCIVPDSGLTLEQNMKFRLIVLPTQISETKMKGRRKQKTE
jgi:hypothetical protein